MDAHKAAVFKISARVKHFHSLQRPFRLFHGSTNSTRSSSRSPDNTVDTSSLNHILSISVSSRTAVVEPNVPLDELVDAALEQGLVPPVVMEFPGITVGGGFAGTSGESSSFRYGAFDTTVEEIEVVLPNGDVVTASKRERADLFWGSASAFGTLGVVTLLRVRLVQAREYVALTYTLETSPLEAVACVRRECDMQENDFVDGIAFAPDSILICIGRMTDDKPEEVSMRRLTRRKDPWFYLRAQEVEKRLRKDQQSGQGAVTVDYIPLKDYLFRYDRGGFWVARYAFKYFLTPFNRITRYLLDPYLRAREMYKAVHASGLADLYMVQDVGVPMAAAPEFQSWLDDQFGIYPLWLCPLKIRRSDPDSAHGIHAHFSNADTPDLMNFGVWGPLPRRGMLGGGGSSARREAVRQNRLLEEKVHQLGGKKWLYAQAFYTEDEFWANYDRDNYEALREKYGAGHLPSVYDKVKTDLEREEWERSGTLARRVRTAVCGVWPVRGVYGFWKAAVRPGANYLMVKRRGKRREKELEEKS